MTALPPAVGRLATVVARAAPPPGAGGSLGAAAVLASVLGRVVGGQYGKKGEDYL